MSEQLINHFRRFVTIEEEDVNEILLFFRALSVKKKQNLLEAGKQCRSHYFVVKGCLRLFFVNETGIEQTTQFALENWWMTDYAAYHSRQASGFFIQAIEQTDLMAIDHDAQETLFGKFPQFEKYFRLIYQRATAAAQVRIKYLYELSREELYLQFRDLYPEFVQRVPQYLLASFLGFTPEYLSEIRRRSLS